MKLVTTRGGPNPKEDEPKGGLAPLLARLKGLWCSLRSAPRSLKRRPPVALDPCQAQRSGCATPRGRSDLPAGFDRGAEDRRRGGVMDVEEFRHQPPWEDYEEALLRKGFTPCFEAGQAPLPITCCRCGTTSVYVVLTDRTPTPGFLICPPPRGWIRPGLTHPSPSAPSGIPGRGLLLHRSGIHDVPTPLRLFALVEASE